MSPRRGQEFWERVVSELESSGLTHEEFAKKHRLNVGSMRAWLYRLRRLRGKTVRLLPVQVAATPGADAGGWIEMVVGDTRLRFAAGTDLGYIGALVTRLRDRC